MSKSIEEYLPHGVVDSEIVQLFFGPVAADDTLSPQRKRGRFLEIVTGVMEPFKKKKLII